MNKNPETRQGYYVTAQMKEVWNVQMEIAQKVIDVCKRHNLKIWFDSGSMLGAVRDKGFIPWDDDIDMGMLREDYEQLCSLAEVEFIYPYFFQTCYNDKGFFACHAKVRKSDTAGILTCETFNRYNQGIFVDIFVFDDVPDAETVWKLEKEIDPYRQLMIDYGAEFFRLKPFLKRIKATIYFLFHDYAKHFYVIDRIAKRYQGQNCEYVTSLTYQYRHPERNIHKKVNFEKIIYVPFEDIMVPIPVGYHNVLTTWYGDYMKPAKIPTVHGSVIFDTKHSYKEILPKLRRKRILTKIKRIFK